MLPHSDVTKKAGFSEELTQTFSRAIRVLCATCLVLRVEHYVSLLNISLVLMLNVSEAAHDRNHLQLGERLEFRDCCFFLGLI